VQKTATDKALETKTILSDTEIIQNHIYTIKATLRMTNMSVSIFEGYKTKNWVLHVCNKFFLLSKIEGYYFFFLGHFWGL